MSLFNEKACDLKAKRILAPNLINTFMSNMSKILVSLFFFACTVGIFPSQDVGKLF